MVNDNEDFQIKKAKRDKAKKREQEAKIFNRPGYWQCPRCTAHVPDNYLVCFVCGKKRHNS